MSLRTVVLTLTVTLGLPGATVTLYDGSGPPPLPWLFSASGTSPSVNTTGGGVTLDASAADDTQAGYFRTAGPLNRTSGYTVRFDIDLLSEDHSNPAALKDNDSIADRAGFSFIALGSDLRGIELAFWMTEVWAQNDGTVKADPVLDPTGTRFTHGEGAAFDFSGGLVRFDLSVLGNSYVLFADGAPLLSGVLRDYSNEGLPYSTPNFLFFGDNTTSARGSARIELVTLTDSAVPEPGGIVLGLGGLLLVALKRRVSAS